jgi:hypothetical protein
VECVCKTLAEAMSHFPFEYPRHTPLLDHKIRTNWAQYLCRSPSCVENCYDLIKVGEKVFGRISPSLVDTMHEIPVYTAHGLHSVILTTKEAVLNTTEVDVRTCSVDQRGG